MSLEQFEKFITKAVEKKEQVFELDKSGENTQKEKEPPRKKIHISPQDAHRIALELIKNENFKNILKEYVAEIIVNSENITRIDVIIDKNNDAQLREVYGLTKEHFQDISNGNLTSFNLAADGPDLAIYFKRATGVSAIRPIDNNKLAIMLNLILNTQPELAPDLQSDFKVK